MTLKINDTNRLTRDELEDYRENSGITELPYKIIKRKYFDSDEPNVTAVCDEFLILPQKNNKEMNKALMQIYKYEHNKKLSNFSFSRGFFRPLPF